MFEETTFNKITMKFRRNRIYTQKDNPAPAKIVGGQ